MSGFITLPLIILGAAVADAGTLTASYPAGTDEGHFQFNRHHKLMMNSAEMAFPADFTLTFGTSNITITNASGAAWPVGARLYLQLDKAGINDTDSEPASPRVAMMNLIKVDLGAPDVLDADFLIKAATSTELPDTETVTYTPDTDGTTPTDGVGPVVVKGGINYWELDVPRNLVSTVTHASSVVAMTWTATGLDEFGNVLVETVTVAATGTSQVDATLKAFKWVRSIALIAVADAEANTVNLGTGDVLGLPMFMPSLDSAVLEFEDNASATAGTMLGGVLTEPSATTGDVRGTYDPNSACDGAKVFSLIVAVSDPKDIGLAQFAG